LQGSFSTGQKGISALPTAEIGEKSMSAVQQKWQQLKIHVIDRQHVSVCIEYIVRLFLYQST